MSTTNCFSLNFSIYKIQKRFFLNFSIFFSLLISSNLGRANNCLQIESIKINGKIVSKNSNTLELKVNDDDLFINLNGLEKNDTFVYQLIGFDPEAIYSQYPIIRYTNIEGGNYTLKICQPKNTINCDTIYLKLNVETEVFSKKWYKPAFIVYIVFILLIIAMLWVLHFNRQKRRVSKFRSKMNSDLHDHIGGSLSSILTFTKLIKKDLPQGEHKINELIDEIYNTSSESIAKLRDTVRILKVKNKMKSNHFTELVEDIIHISKILNKSEIEVKFEQNHNVALLEKQKISFERRDNINGIFQEVCNNIFKHSKAKNVIIKTSTTKEALNIIIEDNGVGFDTSITAEGFGMQSLKTRAQDSFSDLIIFSQLGEGTQITIVIPYI